MAIKKNKQKNIGHYLDEQQMSVLVDLEKTTRKSIGGQIKEGIEMYIKSQKGEGAELQTPGIFSPIVFDRPLRDQEQEE